MVEPDLHISENNLSSIYDLIDDDNDGLVDREEMACFIRVLMVIQTEIKFKSSHTFIRKANEKEQQHMKQYNQEKLDAFKAKELIKKATHSNNHFIEEK